MINRINGIPVYQATIEDDGERMLRVSFVDCPAVESDFIAFSKEKPVQTFAIQDEEQRRVFGVVMRADYPMIRLDAEGNPFYIVFSRETIRRMAEKYMAEGRANNVNLMHVDGSDVEGVTLCQYFIKDSAKGISPEGFEEISDGSLMAEYHVLNDEVWQGVKDGTFRGFSIEVCPGVTPDETSDVDELAAFVLSACTEAKFNSENMSKIKKILAALGEALKFGTMTTDKGVIRWEGGEAVKVGDEIEVVPSEEGAEPVKAEAGEYVGEELIVVVGEDGKVAEVNEKAAEPDPEPEPEPEPEDFGKFAKVRMAFEESYDEKMRKIYDAVIATLKEGVDAWLIECGDDYAVVNVWSRFEEQDEQLILKYEVSWEEDGSAIVANPVEVKPAFVPVDEPKNEPAPEPTPEPAAEEFAAMKAEIESLKAELEEFRKAPASKGAKEAYKAAEKPGSMSAALKAYKARR